MGKLKRPDYQIGLPDLGSFNSLLGEVRQRKDRASTRTGGLADVTPRLRHTFASVAGDLGFSELTVAALLGRA